MCLTYRTSSPSRSAAAASVYSHDYSLVEGAYQPVQGPSPHLALPPPGIQLQNLRQLTRYLYYHSSISRERAEALLKEDGDFLVRDSATRAGEYVLSVQCRGRPAHFVINRQHTPDHQQHLRAQYLFEDIAFNSVPELIRYWVYYI